MASIETDIETPCTCVCVVHQTLRLCVGCGRSLDEIARWMPPPFPPPHAGEEKSMNPPPRAGEGREGAERARIMAQLPSRLAAMSGTTAGVNHAPAMA
jgi:predicted Fe-S protein YdhL (DUF1289 family)